MRRLQPVVWSKGVFLSPQHLQAQDRFLEESFRFVLDSLAFRAWGFLSLQIHSSTVEEGLLQIANASGIFPDGLPFDIGDADDPPHSRSLDECFHNGHRECVFFLAIPQTRNGGINIGPRDTGLSTRFYTELQMLRDENSSGTEKPVSLARKKFGIIASGENLEGSVTLPFARVLRTEAGQYRLDSDFIPPMLNANANERLTSILRGLIEVLIARSGQMGGMRRQRNQSLADFSASDIANFWLLYTVNSHIPTLLQTLRSPHAHPESMFMQLLALAGALTTFSKRIRPQELPAYDHERLGECFAALEVILIELLDTVIPSSVVALPLRQIRDSIYTTEIDDGELLANSRLYLAVAAEIPTADLITRAPALIKLCSATHLETLIRQALPGLDLTHLPSPPQEIPVKLNYQYFSLDRAGAPWEAIQRARNFGAYVPSEIENPQFELILLPSLKSSAG